MSGVAPPGAWVPLPAPVAPRRVRPGAGTFLAAVVLGVLSLVAVGLVGFMVGPPAFPAATALALLPLLAVLGTVLWVDRWEPEPWPALAVAFGWGASVSVLVALVLNSGAQTALLVVGLDDLRAGAVTATFVAPLVEEGIKALGVLLLFLGWRRWFDGPVDGVVYAATVAAGFAFVENILYFGQAVAESAAGGDGGEAVAVVFVLRAVMSPFAHVLFTAAVGLALGWAARRSAGAWAGAFVVGLAVAVGLHALWNGAATLGTDASFLSLYVTVQVPLFLGVVGLVTWLRGREARLVRARLAEYAAGGLLAPQELRMLTSLSARRASRRWARARGGAAAARSMRDFQSTASRLAHHRHRVMTDRARWWAGRGDEAALLAEMDLLRQDLRRRLAV
ncbi:membrane protein [Actinotalea ferrariae CF5-4]|uniref:Membrane protein n=1 Tax=Actinotalea ferrariae CF5-4 TaxID=948458 RepID=A0A021VTH1_9CELL|nr:PrsW family intramembrane metalloprotease [Actinotalea ferrariae]EYR64456.1 membrane protein [Actinotalea ferrariae CF5-4]